MDWTSKVATAKRMIEKYGAAMSLVVATHGTYVPSSDTYSSTLTTYDVIGVKTNPTMQDDTGTYSKSDQIRLLLSPKDINGAALPTLSNADFKIVYGSIIWNPNKIITVDPGGTIILYIVDCK